MSMGKIFDIEEFAIYDGPGIRKTVFLKGCPLNCAWCHNPEGISFKKELMVSKNSCIKCGRCTSVCENKPCIVCGKCTKVCPLNLRKICGIEIDSHELARKLLKDSSFLIKNGGGITISGGEPLAQPKFLLELLEYLKPIHRAIETSGYGDEDIFKEVIKNIDLMFMDIKLMDPIKHQKYTGVDNKKILNNLKILKNSNTKFIIRIPLIPGVNDDYINIENTAKALIQSKNLIQVEMLPYHKTAGAKYTMINKIYDPPFDVNKAPNVFLEIFKKYDIRSRVL